MRWHWVGDIDGDEVAWGGGKSVGIRWHGRGN